MYVRLDKANPGSPSFRDFLAAHHTAIADLDRAAGWSEEARAGFGRAIEIGEALVKAYPDDLDLCAGPADSFRRLALLEYADRRFAEAAKANGRALALYDGIPNPWSLIEFQRACCRALQAGLAGKDGSGVLADAGPAAADKAMELLRKAVAAGYQDLYDLRTDPGLDPLRQRVDFQKLLAELETKSGPNAKPKG
jgi:hypothetical protein